MLCLVLCLVASVQAFVGSSLKSGERYYLYNVYQSKFLAALSTDGTTGRLDNHEPMLCTITADGGNYLIGNCSQTWKLTQEDEGYIISPSSASSKALMFGTGTSTTIDYKSTGFNHDKALWLLVGEEEYGKYIQQKRFTVASLNVDGMPKSISFMGQEISLNPDAKEEAGATAIGQKLKTMGWDVVGVSEDFNYHSQIWDEAWNDGVTDEAHYVWSYNAMTHRGKLDVASANLLNYLSQSPLFDTDGLGLFYKVAGATPSNESWTQWNQHYGYTDNGADGLIKKGYRYYLITLADGTEFDLYTLHMDAETSDEDNAARASQITQLADAIKATDNKRPIVVCGDWNCRYTRDPLKRLFIDALDKDERFTTKDAWIEYGRGGLYPSFGSNAIMADQNGYRRGEVVDKILYINNTASQVRINALSYVQDLSFINEAGEPLADHWPCVVEFEYHQYDPAIDDVEPEKDSLEAQPIYLRNLATGYFLKQGGLNGTHAIQGTYGSPMTFTKVADKVYRLESPIGGLTASDPYMDGVPADWTLEEKDGYFWFKYKEGSTNYALSAKGTQTYPYGPNKRAVTILNYSKISKEQQWQMLTKEQLLEEAKMATEEQPYDLTFMLPGANFDAKDYDGQDAWQGWMSNATRMWCNKSDGRLNIANGNPVAEVFVNTCNEWIGSCSHETKWDINQTITGLPLGNYRVSCQAFQRISNSNTTTATIELYAKGETEQAEQVQLMYEGAQITSSSFGGSTKDGDYYYPNTMAEATLYFNAGYYESSVDVEVTDGTLTLGIRKTSDTGKSNSAWTCFDNFQLIYLGDGQEHEPTGIQTAKKKSDGIIYDLSGRRVQGAQHGIYIIDGKKVIK